MAARVQLREITSEEGNRLLRIVRRTSGSVVTWRRGRPQTFTLPKRQEIKRIALSDPQDLDQPFASWGLSKLADYLVAEGVVTDIPHECLRQLLREENVRFQAVRTWKRSTDPDFKAKRDRIVELYEMAEAGEGVVICLDEFGPLNLEPGRLAQKTSTEGATSESV
jgi:hypothetical protein